jgi:integrase
MVLLHGKPALQAPETKGSQRQVPAPPHVLAQSREHRRRQNEQRLAHADPWLLLDLVFCTSIGTLINADNLKRDLARLATIAGVPRIRVHALRHTYATLAIADAEDGADMVAVSKNLGHARTSITMDIYSHALPQQRRDVVDKLGARLFRGIGDAAGEGR